MFVVGGPQKARAWDVRPYRASDRQDVRDIAVETGWLGPEGARALPDPFIWAEIFTRYFTDEEPEHTWVAERTADQRVGGYLTGTVDAARFERHLARLAPGILLHAATRFLLMRAAPRRAARAMLGSLLGRELAVPQKLRAQFPATFHFAMRPEARGHGLGALLLEDYLGGMRRAGVPGVHVQTMSTDEEASRFVQRAGFQLAASWPLTAFGHVDARPIDLHTWALLI